MGKVKTSKRPNRITEWRLNRGMSLDDLAEATRLSSSYLSRMASGGRNVSLKNLAKIAKALQVGQEDLVPTAALPTQPVPGTMLAAREDGVPYVAAKSPEARRDAISSLLEDRPNAHAWTMKSDILALKGVRAGDIVIIDQSAEAKNGDIVCAQIEEGIGAKTVFRVYQAPNLVGAGFDANEVRIETVDGERVRIVGVMTDLLRHRS